MFRLDLLGVSDLIRVDLGGQNRPPYFFASPYVQNLLELFLNLEIQWEIKKRIYLGNFKKYKDQCQVLLEFAGVSIFTLVFRYQK